MKRLGLLVALIMMAAGAKAQIVITPAQIIAYSQQISTPSNPPTGTYLTYINASGQFACLNPSGGSCLTGGGGGVTSVTGTAPISSSGGSTPAISCPTCAIGPGASTANHIAEFSGTDGLTLIDGGAAPLSATPIFSTAVTGTSMATSGTNTVIVGPVSMTTPAAAGSYRFVVELIQTTAGSGGTCTAGAVTFNLSYKDADTGITYAVGTAPNISVYSMASAAAQTVNTTITGANGAATTFTSVPREFRAASGTAIQYQLYQQTVSNCTTPQVIAVRPALYSLGY